MFTSSLHGLFGRVDTYHFLSQMELSQRGQGYTALWGVRTETELHSYYSSRCFFPFTIWPWFRIYRRAGRGNGLLRLPLCTWLSSWVGQWMSGTLQKSHFMTEHGQGADRVHKWVTKYSIQQTCSTAGQYKIPGASLASFQVWGPAGICWQQALSLYPLPAWAEDFTLLSLVLGNKLLAWAGWHTSSRSEGL